MSNGPLTRRTVLAAGAAMEASALGASVLGPFAASARAEEARPFDYAWLIDEAERRSKAPHVDRSGDLPDALAALTYDQYRDIRFRPERAVWRGENRGFVLDLLHAGFYFRTPVEVAIVRGGTVFPIAYDRDLFDFGPSVPPLPEGPLPFSGFRARFPINEPGTLDEVIVFQGASYFRAVARGQRYGLSARGLALGTGDPGGEEFPAFTAFWIEEPDLGANSLVVYALLEGPSVTGAYRFTIRPGAETIVDVELSLFPRAVLEHAGLAPLTSMFLFDASGRVGHDDFRDAVHDSDGLQIVTGGGERIWRPLKNPATLQVSAFLDRNPAGFGLVQRKREAAEFQDLEARYELRPSAWVEPIGDWDDGAVQLVEIPSDWEINDNIVAFWRPRDPIRPDGPFPLTYRLTWCATPDAGDHLAWVVATRSGLDFEGTRRLFVLDFATPRPLPAETTVNVTASGGTLSNPVLQPNPLMDGARASFELDPDGEDVVELRLVLEAGGTPVSETWLYRWTGS